MSRFGRIFFGIAALLVFGLLLLQPWKGGLPSLGPGAGLPGRGRTGTASPQEGKEGPAGERTPLAPTAPWEERAERVCLVMGRLLFQGNPVPKAQVEWLLLVPGPRIRTPVAARAESGMDGRFTLSAPPGKEGILRARAAGLPPLVTSRRTALGPGEVLPLGDLSFPRPLSPEVLVLDRSEGNPIAKALVQVTSPPGILVPLDPAPRARTGPAGRARLGPLAEGTWKLRVGAAGFSPFQQTLLLPREEKGPMTLYLAKGPGLEGLVVDEKGNPLPGAWVSFQPFLQGEEDHRAGGSLQAGPGGRFFIEGLEKGDWSLEARAPGRAMARPLKAACPGGKPLRLVLHPLPTVSGRVLAPRGKVPRKGKAALSKRGGFAGAWILSPLAGPVDLDKGGRFRITLERFPPPETRWVVVAWSPGLPPGQSGEFFFEKGMGPQNLRIRLPAPGRVTGRVLPASSSRVVVEASSSLPFPPFLPFQEEISLAPGPGGRFILGPLTPGTRRLRFSAPGRVPVTRALTVLSGKTQDVGTVSLLPGVVVGGILLGPSGKPEPGGWVWLRPTSGGNPRKTAAGPEGRFRFPPVPPGKYFIQGCRRDAAPVTALEDYAASRRLLVLSGGAYWIQEPISLEKRH